MRIAFYQMAPSPGEKEENLSRVEEALDRVKADLAVLPELFTTGYSVTLSERGKELAEEIPQGETVRRMAEFTRRTGMALAGGILEREGDAVYNSAVLILPPTPARPTDAVGDTPAQQAETPLGHYRKVHLFNEEKRWFTPGDKGFPLFEFQSVRLGLLICFDWVFPEAARILSLKGMDLLLHPSNLVLPYCQDAMRTRALENGIFAVTVNRVGVEEREGEESPLAFTGLSQVVGPRGEVICRASNKDEELRVIEIDPLKAREKLITGTNHLLGDRRPDCYPELVDPRLVPDRTG